MLSAAEASMDAAAEDDAARRRNRAKLYAPPRGTPRASAGGRARPAGGGMDLSAARALMAQMVAEDATLSRSG
jgi:hypothetical protein